MMRKFLGALACAFALLGIAASLELAGLQSALGVLSHTIPAGLIASVGVPRGLVLSDAHGPPFLRPLGVAIVYGVPVALLAVIHYRTRPTRRRTTTPPRA